MEIWIANKEPKTLKKKFPFLKFYLIINIQDICKKVGYNSTLNNSIYANYLINAELKKKLLIVNKSKKFFRVLLILENIREGIENDLLEFSKEHNLKYDKFYVLDKETNEFVLKGEI